MTAAQIFGLDDQHPRVARRAGAKARPGDPAADDQDIEIPFRGAGYGLESRAV